MSYSDMKTNKDDELVYRNAQQQPRKENKLRCVVHTQPCNRLFLRKRRLECGEERLVVLHSNLSLHLLRNFTQIREQIFRKFACNAPSCTFACADACEEIRNNIRTRINWYEKSETLMNINWEKNELSMKDV